MQLYLGKPQNMSFNSRNVEFFILLHEKNGGNIESWRRGFMHSSECTRHSKSLIDGPFSGGNVEQSYLISQSKNLHVAESWHVHETLLSFSKVSRFIT